MGRNVLISGASHGIGAATAIAFAKDGCNVGINYHNNRAGAEETAAECRKYGVDAQIYCADIGCREQAVGMMRDFIEHFGTVDVLINNAGGALKMPKGEFCDMPLDYWDSQIALNLSGAAYLSHEAIKNMKEHNIPFTILGNPFHLNDEVCRRLKEYGCEKYQLSLDGLRQTHDWFRRPGSFDCTLEKIACLKRAGIRAVIMTTVSGTNIDEIPAQDSFMP